MVVTCAYSSFAFIEMEAARQRMRTTAAHKKKEEKTKVGESSSASKAVGKRATKRKAEGKDDRPLKKAFVTPGEKLPKRPSPPKSGLAKC